MYEGEGGLAKETVLETTGALLYVEEEGSVTGEERMLTDGERTLGEKAGMLGNKGGVLLDAAMMLLDEAGMLVDEAGMLVDEAGMLVDDEAELVEVPETYRLCTAYPITVYQIVHGFQPLLMRGAGSCMSFYSLHHMSIAEPTQSRAHRCNDEKKPLNRGDTLV